MAADFFDVVESRGDPGEFRVNCRVPWADVQRARDGARRARPMWRRVHGDDAEGN
jgi:hypothetical protein